MDKEDNQDCFVIMPISELDDYDDNHFFRVYEDIIKPAVGKTEFEAIRADDVKETNFIHLDILRKLIDAPMAICDLSTCNPNVLFELGIRQAFDKPVVLIQEKGTPKIFDIGPLRYLEYDRGMKYHDVLRAQSNLTIALNETKAAEGRPGNINSIVRLMSLSGPAAIPNLDSDNKEAFAIDIVQSQLSDMRKMMEISLMENRKVSSKGSISSIEYERISSKLDRLVSLRRKTPAQVLEKEGHRLLMETEELAMNCSDEAESRMFQYLMQRIHRAMSSEIDVSM